MRQLNPSTNLILAVLCGLGLLGTLSMPWFAAPVTDPVPTDGPVERAAFQVGHVFSTSAKGTISGLDALGSGRMVLVALVVAVALLGLAVATAAIRHQAEDAMRLLALAIPVVVILVAIAHSGTTTPVRIHYGTLAGILLSLLTASAAWHGASMREKPKTTAVFGTPTR